MRKQWKNHQAVNVMSEEEKVLFSDTKPVTLDTVNKKLNLLFHMLTDIPDENTVDVPAEQKGIFPQTGTTSEDVMGQMMAQQMLTNADFQSQINVIGKNVADIWIKQP